MRRQELARIAQRATGLRQLIVLSMPDCLLVDNWPLAMTDVESTAALMGSVLHAIHQTAQSSLGQSETGLVTIETAEAVLFLAPMGQDLAAGFVFDRATTLGLARIQIRDLLLDLEPRLRGHEPAQKPPAAVPIPTEPKPAAPVTTEPQVTALGPPPAAETVRPSPAEMVPPPPVETVRPTPPPETVRPAPAETVRPGAADTPPRPRAVRLLEFLHRYAPDPHVSLLRLSLRTGIALEKLDRPELLTPEQVESMAASVRDIIGQEQLGI